MMLQTTLLETINKLPESLQQEVLHYAEFLAEKYAKAEPPAEMTKKPRKAGTMKGTFILPLPDDFDEPLEDFQEYIS